MIKTKPPAKPISAAQAKIPTKRTEGAFTNFLVKAPSSLMGQLEAARASFGYRTRNEAVVRILKDGVAKVLP